jgi:hypothetical protein
MYRGRLARIIVVILIIGSAAESAAVHFFTASDGRTTFLTRVLKIVDEYIQSHRT